MGNGATHVANACNETIYVMADAERGFVSMAKFSGKIDTNQLMIDSPHRCLLSWPFGLIAMLVDIKWAFHICYL